MFELHKKLFALFFIAIVAATTFAVPLEVPKPILGKHGFIPQKYISKQQGAGKQSAEIQEAFSRAIMKHLKNHPFDGTTTGNANEYIDVLLAIVRYYMDSLGLDNISLPDESYGFSTEVLFVPVFANLNLTNGFLKGMDTLHRTGDATITQSQQYNLIIDTYVGFTSPSAGYSITTDVEGIVAHGSVAATIETISVHFQMFIDTENFSAYVTLFDVVDIGKIDVQITGLGIFNWLAEIVTEFFSNLLKNFVANLIEGTIKQYIQIVLDKLFPGNVYISNIEIIRQRDVTEDLRNVVLNIRERSERYFQDLADKRGEL